MSAMVSETTGVPMVCTTVYSVADQRNHQSSASLAFVRRIHRWPVNSPHKGLVITRKMFPFDDVIMLLRKIFDGGVQLRFSIGYPWLRKIWSKTHPWLRRISWLWAHSGVILRNFSANILLLRSIFQKQAIIHSKMPIFRGFHKKIYPWLRTSGEIYTLG